MDNNVKIVWLEQVSSKTNKPYDHIEYVYTDKNGETLTITKDFDMNDVKRYVLKQLGIKKEVL